MSTVIYPSPIFGPVHSRRLGLSLGINLMPGDGKICTFDCVYCECGLNGSHRPHLPRPSRSEVAEALEVVYSPFLLSANFVDCVYGIAESCCDRINYRCEV